MFALIAAVVFFLAALILLIQHGFSQTIVLYVALGSWALHFAFERPIPWRRTP